TCARRSDETGDEAADAERRRQAGGDTPAVLQHDARHDRTRSGKGARSAEVHGERGRTGARHGLHGRSRADAVGLVQEEAEEGRLAKRPVGRFLTAPPRAGSERTRPTGNSAQRRKGAALMNRREVLQALMFLLTSTRVSAAASVSTLIGSGAPGH